MTDSDRTPWLEAAAGIGRRLAATAEWREDRCSWLVRTSTRVPGKREGMYVPAAPTLYQGTAGIALFLVELFRHTREVSFLHTALGALRESVAAGSRLDPGNNSFHSGRAGIAFSLVHCGRVGADERRFAEAEALLRPLIAAPASETSDVISGPAGSIPALLWMAPELPSAVTTDLALRFGEHLISKARRRVSGWSWGGLKAAADDLTGFSHGASGYAHAFLELFAISGDPWFRHAAEQAMAYERFKFDPESGNWPDFRNRELSELLENGRWDLLREHLLGDGEPFPYQHRCNTLWCHGAPGIGLARLRAVQLLDDPVYLREAQVAVGTTLRAVRMDTIAYSLCHGHFGNSETLLFAAQVLGRPDLRAAAEARADVGRMRYSVAGRAWPSGTVDGGPDPSLLLGDAGIGYFYLRLYDESTPRFLCLDSPKNVRVAVEPRDPDRLRRGHIAEFFATTVRSFTELGYPASAAFSAEDSGPERIVETIRDAIVNQIDSETDPLKRELLVDASRVDLARFNLESEFWDRCTEICNRAIRRPLTEIDWESAELRRADSVSLVKTERDWAAPGGRVTGSNPVVTVLYRTLDGLRSRTVNLFCGIVLESAGRPGTAREIAERIAAATDGPSTDELLPKVVDQLKNAYSAGLVDCIYASAPTPVSV